MSHLLQFTNSSYKQLYMGIDCYLRALDVIIDQNQLKHVFLVSTNSLYDTEYYQSIQQCLSKQLVAEFYQSKAHTPDSTIQAAMDSIEACPTLDAIVAFGGSSVVE